MDSGLKRCLMEIFYCLKSMDGEQRELQFKLINDQFDIVYWQNRSDKNSPYMNDNKEDGINPYYSSRDATITEVPYFITKFAKPQVRGRRKVTFADQYAIIQASGGTMPYLKCKENTAVTTGEFGQSLRGRLDDGWERALHPHISAEQPCLGSFENMMFKEAQTNPVGYMSLVSKFYRTWYVGSAYWDINNMTPLYADADENGKTPRLLTAIEHERFRQHGGIRTTTLRTILPLIDTKTVNLNRYLRAMEVLSALDYGFQDMMYGYIWREINRAAKPVDSFEPIWDTTINRLNMLSDEGMRFYRQDMKPDPRRRLREMQYACAEYVDHTLLIKCADRFTEMMQEFAMSMLEELNNLGEGYLHDLLDSSGMRRDLLLSDPWKEYWMLDENESAEYLSCSIPFRQSAAKYTGFTEADGQMARFWPEEVQELLREQKFECGRVAIKKLEKQKEEILNEIKTLNSNPIEDKILQQQISF